MIESKGDNRIIGNYHNLSIAKMIFEKHDIIDIKKIIKIGKNRVRVVFKSFQSANNFWET